MQAINQRRTKNMNTNKRTRSAPPRGFLGTPGGFPGAPEESLGTHKKQIRYNGVGTQNQIWEGFGGTQIGYNGGTPDWALKLDIMGTKDGGSRCRLCASGRGS
jgi:hypothetical protein